MLRLRSRESLRELGAAARAEKSAAIAAHLVARIGSGPATVFGFAPLRIEPDWLPAIGAQWRMAFPRIEGEVLYFHHVADVADLAPGPFGTRQPAGGEVVPPGEVGFVFVPGLAFDRSGARLGRGGGFYDRFLADPALSAPKIAVCFACQIFEWVPTEPHDAKVDAFVTEDGWTDVRSTEPGRD